MYLAISITSITRDQIQWAIKEEAWQRVRISMKGTTLEEKIAICNNWLKEKDFSDKSKIQVINYINALKRSFYSKEIYKYLI